MARRFTNTTTGQAPITSAWPITAFPFTMACRVRCSDVTTFQIALVFYDATFVNGAEFFIQNSQAVIRAFNNAAVDQGVFPVVGPSVNVYSNVVLVYTSASQRNLYIDGTTGNNTVADTVTCTWGTFPTRFELCRSQPALTTDLADVAVWNIALAASDAARYIAGLSPLLVRPDALAWHNELFGRGSPEPSLVSGLSYTVGTAALVDDPPILRPRRVAVTPPPTNTVRFPPFQTMVA